MEYTVRVTRHPLTETQIAKLQAAGQLPRDYRDRSVLATDFVKLDAADDAEAAMRALGKTKLHVAGETIEFHEAQGGGDFRKIA